MNDFIILTDSSCDLPQQMADELGLVVLPLTVTIGGQTYANYLDEREISFADFYSRLRGGELAVTAAVNYDAFEKLLRGLIEEGNDVLYLGFSSGLSSTYSAGAAAAAALSEEYPERKILALDTLCASMGQGLLVYYAAKYKQAGHTIEETYARILELRPHLAHWFTVDDLHHLKRGGRISAATALVGTALGIKPVLHVDDEGKLINVGKARGRKKSILALADKLTESAIRPENQIIFISHGDCLEDAEYLAQVLRERHGMKEICINHVGPVIGAHSGPGTLALFFLAGDRG